MLKSFPNFDALPIGLAAIDEQLTVRGWNATLAAWSRTTVEAADGRRLDELFPDFKRQKYESRLRAVFEQGQTAVFSVRMHESFLPLVQSSGRPLIHKVRISPLQGESGVALVVVEDVTHSIEQLTELREERRRLRAIETSLREQQQALQEMNSELADSRRRAEEANQAKSAFLANMSHEIRTPLTAINGFAQIVCDYATDQFVLDAGQRVLRNGEHLLMVVNDILDLSRIEAGRLEVQHQQCDARRIVREVTEDLADHAHDKGLRLELQIDEEDLPEVMADPMRLRQVLFNLIDNAIKFTSNGAVDVSVRSGDGCVQFSVVDTGIGIDAESLDEVFDCFTQADAGTQRRHGGAGLGLAICRRLVELMRGEISVQSKAGEGSAFTVSLPCVPNADTLQRIPDEPAIERVAKRGSNATDACTLPLAGMTVVVAEDGVDNQKLIDLLLTRAGALVEVYENGQLAVDAVLSTDRREPADLVILDMQMPVMDGYSAAAALRRVGYDGPVMALTAHAMERDRTKALDAGCDVYAVKPIDPDRLVEVCRSMIRRRAVADYSTVS